MPKKGKKKDKVAEEYSDLEIMPRTKIIYKYTKSIIGAYLEFKWGKIYHMFQDNKITDASLENLPLFYKILQSGITKVATRPELFPCSEVIGWIL